MRVNTKYKAGDMVYYMRSQTIRRDPIFKIEATEVCYPRMEPKLSVRFYMDDYQSSVGFSEDKLFDTKAEVAAEWVKEQCVDAEVKVKTHCPPKMTYKERFSIVEKMVSQNEKDRAIDELYGIIRELS